MYIEDAMRLPEAPPILVDHSPFGYAAPMAEGEYYWRLDDVVWWTISKDGVRYRQRYEDRR